jgi:hypothetical protein
MQPPIIRRASVESILTRGITAARALAETEGEPCVYVGGALTAGLGSPHSDIDLFVLGDRPSSIARQFEYDGQRVDVETVTAAQLTGTLELVTPYRPTMAEMSTVAACTRGRLDMLVRFHLADIVADDGRLAALRAAVDAALPDLTAMLVTRHAVDCLNLLEDVTGAQQNGDSESALMQALAMYSRAVEAVLCQRGDRYVGAKWIWLRWARTMAPLPDAPPLHGAAPPGRTATDLVHDAQDLLAMAMTGTLFRPPAAPDLPDVPATPDMPDRRPAELVPMRTADGVSLYSVSSLRAVSLSWQGLLLWALAGRRDRHRAAGELLDLLARQHGRTDVDRDSVLRYHDHLLDLGVLEAE